MLKAQGPQPSETEVIGLRMAALKFIESELENLKLNEVYPEDTNCYRRVTVSLDCSAWVRGEAGAALVYIDLYPYNADRWCHKAGKILKKYRGNKYTREEFERRWRNLIEKELKYGFKPFKKLKQNVPDKESIAGEKKREDWTAFCHDWLKRNGLFPRIVNVERMGTAEYLILAEGDYRSSEFGIGARHPSIPVSIDAKSQSAEQTQQISTSVRPLSLAFIAGSRRAGWLFMPSKTKEGIMPPTERRLRMVVDIPKEMKKLNIHVHKVFLCPKLGVLPGAKFKNQMKNLDEARRILTEADKLYKKSLEGKPPCSSPRHYRLIKTRMRNLLYQGWSEEIAVSIP
jgi:hypothetical protein